MNSYLVKGHVDGVGDHEGAVVAHEEDVLVPEHLAEPLALLDHGGGLVTRVEGAPVKEPATLLESGVSVKVRCQVSQLYILQCQNIKSSYVRCERRALVQSQKLAAAELQ